MAVARGVAAAVLALATPALADLPDEIQVYDDALDPRGVFGVELHLNASLDGNTVPSFPGEITTGNAQRATFEFSLGLGGGFEAGLYIPTALDATGKFWLPGVKARMKYIGRQANGPASETTRGDWFWGVNVEVGVIDQRFDPGQWGAEVRPIIGWRSRDWEVAFNPNFEFTLGGGLASATPDFSPGLKVGRRVTPEVMLGGEFYRDFGPVGGFDPPGAQGTTLFAVIDVDHKPFVFNFGVGHGWNGADPWVVKAIIELPF